MIFIIVLFFLLNPSDNGDKPLHKVKGIWVADGTQHQFIIGYENGEYIYTDNSTPFYLNFDGTGKYTLKMGEHTETGTYSVNQENVIFQNESGFIKDNCNIKDKIELHCENYASLYIKK
jgi:hypothetical protein